MTRYTSQLSTPICISVDGVPLVILPGTHDIAHEGASAMLSHAGLRDHLLAGRIVIEGSIGTLSDDDTPLDLLRMTTREAAVLVMLSDDVDTLLQWQLADGRKGVHSVIRRRLTQLGVD